MRRVMRIGFVGAMAAMASLTHPAAGAGTPLDPRDAQLPKLTLPDEFAMVFSFGYVNDFWPKDEQAFESILQNMKRTGINTIHCKYLEWRQKLCEKHGVKMMIDLAVPEHDLKQAPLCAPDEVQPTADLSGAAEKFAVLKQALDAVNKEIGAIDKDLKAAQDKADLEKKKADLVARKEKLDKEKSLQIGANVKAICLKVKGSKGVWGYGLWYDNGTSGKILNHAVEKLRSWDPTHVTFVGSYRHGGLETVTINPGCYGWYDFHWERGTLWHHLDMMVLQDICGRRGAVAGCYAGYSGFQKDCYTVNQCLASGVKMIIWFIGGPIGREPGSKWSDDQELVKLAAEFRHMYGEIGRIGPCLAYYSTPVTKTHDDKPVASPAVPRWHKPFPADHWAQVTSGEAMVGFFKYADGTDAMFVANHNAFAAQKMVIELKPGADGKPRKADLFDRANGGWKPLEVSAGAAASVTFDLAPAGGELLRVQGRP